MSIETMNINSNEDGMVPLNPYVPPRPEIPPLKEQPQRLPPPIDDKFGEKNIQNNQSIMMDSTPISDIMGNDISGGGGMMMMEQPPMPVMQKEPRMQSMMMSAPQQGYSPNQQQMMIQDEQQEQKQRKKETGNPFNLTDDQWEALVVGICAVIAISKPVQEKLAGAIPKFTNEMGGRSAIGLATTGLVAGLSYYIIQRYIMKK